MNPIREAAEAIHAAEKRVSALSLRMDVSHKYVHVTGRLKHWELSRSVSWAEIDDALVNPLTISIAAIENELTTADAT